MDIQRLKGQHIPQGRHSFNHKW